LHWEIRGLEKLSFRERQAVMLKESGRSGEEIARILNISQSTVSTILVRAKAKGYKIVGILQDSELGLDCFQTEEVWDEE